LLVPALRSAEGSEDPVQAVTRATRKTAEMVG
jgi:hypothetical protein